MSFMFDSCPTCWKRRQNPHIQYSTYEHMENILHIFQETALVGYRQFLHWFQSWHLYLVCGILLLFLPRLQGTLYIEEGFIQKTEEKAKVVAASWRTEFFNVVPLSLYCTYALGRFEEQADFHPILQCVLVQSSLFFNISFYKIAKARQKMEENLSPKKQGRPLPTLLYKSFFFYTVWYRITITISFFLKFI